MTFYVITHKHFNYQSLPIGYTPLLVGANKNQNPDNYQWLANFKRVSHVILRISYSNE